MKKLNKEKKTFIFAFNARRKKFVSNTLKTNKFQNKADLPPSMSMFNFV